MTSKASTFVFVQLPGSVSSVVAARYELESTAAGPLGRLVYGRSYLERPESSPLDPVHLPLSEEEFTTTKIGGMFGALRDGAPDTWGRMILERGRPGRSWTELDYLLEASDQRVGALRFGPQPDGPTPGDGSRASEPARPFVSRFGSAPTASMPSQRVDMYRLEPEDGVATDSDYRIPSNLCESEALRDLDVPDLHSIGGQNSPQPAPQGTPREVPPSSKIPQREPVSTCIIRTEPDETQFVHHEVPDSGHGCTDLVSLEQLLAERCRCATIPPCVRRIADH